MTLILASKFIEGVVFAYDLLCYGDNEPEIMLPNKRIERGRFQDKVGIVGRLAIGGAGKFFAKEHLGFTPQAYSCWSSVEQERANLRDLIIEGMHIRKGIRIILPSDVRDEFLESYLFAGMDKDTPRIYVCNDIDSLKLEEKEWAGIGCGMYPLVQSFLELAYTKGSTLDETIEMLDVAMGIASTINAKSDDPQLHGSRFMVVTQEGVRKEEQWVYAIE